MNKKILSNKNKFDLEFEKSITRDWCVIYGEMWHEIFTKKFKEQIGWSYSEVIFEGGDNTLSLYRAPKEHIIGMRKYITKQLDKDPDWIHRHAEIVKKQVDNILLWSEQIKKKLFSKYTNLELLGITKKFINDSLNLGSVFVVMLWFPIQMENYKKKEPYKRAVNKAIETRGQIDKLGPFGDSFGRALASEVARRANISKELSKYISYKELLNYFEKNIVPDIKTLNKRKNYFIITNDGILYEPILDYAKRYSYSIKKIKTEKIFEIKGQMAYKGSIKGEAQIIKSKDAFDKFREGNILVTGMTTPDFLPIMKKASAFITDEGGITCHAAIVAREMRKPCIIGTKIATEVLKSGDLVEIDADKGIVKILNK